MTMKEAKQMKKTAEAGGAAASGRGRERRGEEAQRKNENSHRGFEEKDSIKRVDQSGKGSGSKSGSV